MYAQMRMRDIHTSALTQKISTEQVHQYQAGSQRRTLATLVM